ncbi:MAG: hypothetical protein LBR89_01455 [Holosporales bacterium]|jgi:peptidoglycan hydrolase CwlO-like protein|nr:hypothetical protein [Holosporales bacterium]
MIFALTIATVLLTRTHQSDIKENIFVFELFYMIYMKRIILSGIGALSMLVATAESCTITIVEVVPDLSLWGYILSINLNRIARVKRNLEYLKMHPQALTKAIREINGYVDEQLKALQEKETELQSLLETQQGQIAWIEEQIEALRKELTEELHHLESETGVAPENEGESY